MLVFTGSLLATLLLARLDTAFTIGALIAARLVIRKRNVVREGLCLAGPAALTLAIYCLLNVLAFGTSLPVSGTAKALGGPWLNSGPLWALILGTNSGELKSIPLGLAFIAVPVAIAWHGMRSAAPSRLPGASEQMWRYLLVLLAGQLLHALYLCIGSSWPIWPWYGYSRTMIGTLALAFATLVLAEKCPGGLAPRAPRLAGLFVCLALLIGSGLGIHRRLELGANDGSYWVRSEHDARVLQRILPSGATIAMGDLAGSLAFWLPRPFVQTEGLLETRAYLNALGDRLALHAYFQARGVTHVAAADFRTTHCAVATADCHLIVEPKFE
jgi:hypothetical protein